MVAPGDSIKSREQFTKFYQLFTKEFGDIFFIIMDRCQIVDLSISSHIKFLSFVADHVFSPVMISWYQKLGFAAEDKMTQIQNKAFDYLQVVENDNKEKQKLVSIFLFLSLKKCMLFSPPKTELRHFLDLYKIILLPHLNI